MARRCDITGKGVQSGNNVSHSNRKTRRRFLPNLQKTSIMSDVLGRTVTLCVSAATLRTLDHNGGLDEYLLSTPNRKLSEEAVTLKRRIRKARDARKGKAA